MKSRLTGSFIQIRNALFLALISLTSQGQVSKPVHSSSPSKSLPPKVLKLKTMLGKNINGASVPVEEGLQLITFPLRVIDDKNIPCTILSYNFTYRRKGIVEDEETQKKRVVFTTVGDRFTTTPLPTLWKDNISESLQKEEYLYFFDIIVKDKYGRRTFAPEIKITIK